MPINPHAVGLASDPFEVSWSPTDCMLYALGVGAGATDPGDELAFTTDNSEGVVQLVLPTFPVVFASFGVIRKLGSFDWTKVLHAEHGLVVHRLPGPAGRARCISRIADLRHTGTGALLTRVMEARDAETEELLFENRVVAFIRDEPPADIPKAREAALPRPPDRKPDFVVTYPTQLNQALVYRLADGPNPLHSDPTFARRAGFDRPILHGLCTYGVAGRALLHTVCDGDPYRFGAMDARFRRPVYPGDTLTTSIWRDEEGAVFRTDSSSGATALDGGRFRFPSHTVEARRP